MAGMSFSSVAEPPADCRGRRGFRILMPRWVKKIKGLFNAYTFFPNFSSECYTYYEIKKKLIDIKYLSGFLSIPVLEAVVKYY